MTREDAIKYLEQHGFIDDEVKDMCIEALGNDTNVGSKWIPCSERLPLIDRNVLLTVAIAGKMAIEIGSRVELLEWCIYDEYYNYTDNEWEVIAWQTLPEPYKGE